MEISKRERRGTRKTAFAGGAKVDGGKKGVRGGFSSQDGRLNSDRCGGGLQGRGI